MNTRTIRDFTVPTNIWPAVGHWASAEGFKLIDDNGIKRRYQKGNGLIVLPTQLEISQSDGNVHLEVWIHVSEINRFLSFHILPAEINIESGGIKAVIPRTVARGSVNRLMIHLGQPLIS